MAQVVDARAFDGGVAVEIHRDEAHACEVGVSGGGGLGSGDDFGEVLDETLVGREGVGAAEELDGVAVAAADVDPDGAGGVGGGGGEDGGHVVHAGCGDGAVGDAHGEHEVGDARGVLVEVLEVLEVGLAGEEGGRDVRWAEGLAAAVGGEVGREDGGDLDDVGEHHLEHGAHGLACAQEHGDGRVGEARGGGGGFGEVEEDRGGGEHPGEADWVVLVACGAGPGERGEGGVTQKRLLGFDLAGQVREGDALRPATAGRQGGDGIEDAPFLENPHGGYNARAAEPVQNYLRGWAK